MIPSRSTSESTRSTSCSKLSGARSGSAATEDESLSYSCSQQRASTTPELLWPLAWPHSPDAAAKRPRWHASISGLCKPFFRA